MLFSRRGTEGFSLIELIVYIAIVSAVLIVAVVLSIDLLRGRAKSTSLEAVNQNARLALERMTTAIRNADLIQTGGSTFGTSPGRLSLQMPDSAVNPTVFDVSGSTLRITEGTGSPQPLTSPDIEVTSLIFTHLNQAGSEGVRISLGLMRVNPQGVQEFNVQQAYVASAILR